MSDVAEEEKKSHLERLAHSLTMIERRWRKGAGLDGERGLDLIGQIHEITGLLAVEMSQLRATFSAMPVRRRDEDEEQAREAMMDQRQVMTLIDVLDDEDLEPSKQDRELVNHLREIADAEDAAVCLRREFIAEGTRVLRAMIAFIWQGSPTEAAMIKRVTAITRRYQREKLSGITQTQVARIHGEQSRCAGVSARERNVHDEQFERVGVRGAGAADRGLKTESTKQKNRAAAMNNSNRKCKHNKQTTHNR